MPLFIIPRLLGIFFIIATLAKIKLFKINIIERKKHIKDLGFIHLERILYIFLKYYVKMEK